MGGSWWSVGGLLLDFVGFAIIAAELFLQTRLVLIAEICRKYDESLKVLGDGNIFPEFDGQSWSDLQPKEMDFDDLSTRVRTHVGPPFEELSQNLLKSTRPIRYFRALKLPPLDAAHFRKRYGASPSSVEEVRWQLATERFIDPCLGKLRMWHSRFQNFVPAAIISILAGFALQVIGSWPD
ncbi:MAG: hypothetical protein K8H74_17820 [Notoacmeibacter sp.]|nr:hypothetical protein [Notoacmeibacter sp.]